MNLEIIANVIFAIVIIRWVELGVEKAVDYYYGKKRKKAFDNLLVKLQEEFNNDFDCDDDCDVCNPEPVKPKKVVKKAAPKKKTVKKAVAKKRK